jgi:hypothetical protein
MEGWIMGDIRTSGLGGVPFGNNSGRPANVTGQPYFNGETARLELYTTSGSWENIVQEVPAVTSITGNYSELTDSGIISIFGTNFVTGAIAAAIGTNGVVVNAASTTFNSLVELTATFTGLSNAYEPYDIRVTNPSSLFGIMPDSLYVNASPVWQTSSGLLGDFSEQISISISATATDSDSTITYSLASGSTLPSGVSLNSSTGLISGTLPDISSDTTYTFTINASDGVNIVPRAFSIISRYTINIDYLLVAGGGGGSSIIGGGGGGGGVLSGTTSLTSATSVSLTVGAGGRGGTGYQGGDSDEAGYPGFNSVFDSITAIGGGGTTGWDSSGTPSFAGQAPWTKNGGSGGGGGGSEGQQGSSGYPNRTGGAGTNGQGFAGGNGDDPYGSGGGGAGEVGHSQSVHGNLDGGDGIQSSITGAATYYGGGGGGGRRTSGAGNGPSIGGLGGGGNGMTGGSFSSDQNGTANTGGGGGGGNYSGPSAGNPAGGAGGSGVVIIAYPNTFPALTTIPGTLTYDQPTRSGYRVYRFTAGSGTITI